MGVLFLSIVGHIVVPVPLGLAFGWRARARGACAVRDAGTEQLRLSNIHNDRARRNGDRGKRIDNYIYNVGFYFDIDIVSHVQVDAVRA